MKTRGINETFEELVERGMKEDPKKLEKICGWCEYQEESKNCPIKNTSRALKDCATVFEMMHFDIKPVSSEPFLGTNEEDIEYGCEDEFPDGEM